MDNSSTPPLESLSRDERHAVPPAPATSISVAPLDALHQHQQQQQILHASNTAIFASLTPVVDPGSLVQSMSLNGVG